jgi:LemA protein
VQEFNTQIRSFPANLIASMFGFTRMPLFEAEAAAQKAPKVSF